MKNNEKRGKHKHFADEPVNALMEQTQYQHVIGEKSK